MPVTTTAFALIVTFLFPNPETLAHADVHVIESGLTAAECMTKLQDLGQDEYGPHTILSCSFDYDF
jgi:hypothetical protein